MIKSIYERLTGMPWTTERSMAAEFGPTPATRYPELASYSDAELLVHGPAILATLRAGRATRKPYPAGGAGSDAAPRPVPAHDDLAAVSAAA